jgi:succinate dehydrogenase / fumarate reductase flavoprotein subunit
VGDSGLAVYLDFADAIKRLGRDAIEERYGNLFEMYDQITGENPYAMPMRIYPAVHYTMGGLWVDYNLMSNIPGLFVLGEANFSDHGANRLGASALMQGLGDGYFVIPYTLANYLASATLPPVTTEHDGFKEAQASVQDWIDKLFKVKGKTPVTELHRKLGKVMWDNVGMARNDGGLKQALQKVRTMREEFWSDVRVPGDPSNVNKSLEMSLRVSDYMEFAELMTTDALQRTESCGCHFREESQTEEGEAQRDDQKFSYVAAWEYKGAGKPAELHTEPLTFEFVKPAQRSYK